MPRPFVRVTLPLILWACLIMTATSIPGSPDREPFPIPEADKAVHLLMYAGLGFLSMRRAWIVRREWSESHGSRVCFAAGALFASLDEIHQRFIPYRSCSAADLMADLTGLAIGIAVVWLVPRARPS